MRILIIKFWVLHTDTWTVKMVKMIRRSLLLRTWMNLSNIQWTCLFHCTSTSQMYLMVSMALVM